MAQTTLIKNATVILPSGRAQTNLFLKNGKIAAVDAPPTTSADEIIDAAGLVLSRKKVLVLDCRNRFEHEPKLPGDDVR